MPGLAMIYQGIVAGPCKQLSDKIELEGLTKLIAEGTRIEGGVGSPDWSKLPKEARIKKWREMLGEWERTHSGPHPLELMGCYVWMPQKLVTEDTETPLIKQAYTPIKFLLPTAENETYGELKERIERESMGAVEHIRGHYVKGKVNAFYIGNLNHDYEIPEDAKQCSLIARDNFLNQPVRDLLIPRIGFDLCLFETLES